MERPGRTGSGAANGDSNCAGDSCVPMFKNDGRASDTSEPRFESADTYAESCKLLVSTSVLLPEASLALGFILPVTGACGKEASVASLPFVYHLGRGRGRCKAEGVEVCGLALARLKWDEERPNPAFPRFASTCLLKASNSGFASIDSCFGITAAKDFTEEEGELQFSWDTTDESRGSAAGSILRPK
jgi:hypothetical protein